MKKYIFFMGIIILLVIGLGWVFWPKEKDIYFYVLTESHYVLYDEDNKLSIKYFSNDPDFKLIDQESGGFIEDEDASIKLLVASFELEKIHNEIYLDELHYGYKMTFDLPEIKDSYYLKKFYLKLYTKGKEYRLYAGDLFVEYTEDFEKLVPWVGLEGIKGELPKITQILVDLSDEVEIESIIIGPHEVSYYFGDKILIILIPDDVHIFQSTYVKIVTNQGVTYLPQFEYMRNFQLLSSGYYHKYNP